MTDPVSQPDRDAIRANVKEWSLRPSFYRSAITARYLEAKHEVIPALLSALEAVEAERDALRGGFQSFLGAVKAAKDTRLSSMGWDEGTAWVAVARAIDTARALLSEDSWPTSMRSSSDRPGHPARP